MGIGTARGDDRAVAAAEMAISSPLLEASIDGAHGVLLSIQGGSDLGLFEINEAAQLVANSAATDANIIFGAVIDDALGDEVRVTVIAAGFDEPQPGRPRPRTTAYSAAPYGAASNSAAPNGAASNSAPSSSAAASALASAAAAPGQAGAAAGEPSSGRPADWRPFQLGDARPAAPAGAGEPDESAAAVTARPATPVNGGPPASASSQNPDGAMSDAATAERIPAPRHASADDAVESPAQDPGGPGRSGRPDTTRRKSVVFEEDDELDVPDFLK